VAINTCPARQVGAGASINATTPVFKLCKICFTILNASIKK
jgi:hypothetical protein